MFDVATWPEAPMALRPKKLYVNVALSMEDTKTLAAKGWEVVDTRTLSSASAQERLETVKATLEGIMSGTIEANKVMKDFLDLEMYLLGIKGKGAQATDSGELRKDELDTLLDFKSPKSSPDFKERMRQLENTTNEPKRKSRRAK